MLLQKGIQTLKSVNLGYPSSNFILFSISTLRKNFPLNPIKISKIPLCLFKKKIKKFKYSGMGIFADFVKFLPIPKS